MPEGNSAGKIKPAFWTANELLPLGVIEGILQVACWDALDDFAHKALVFAFEGPVQIFIGTRSEIKAQLDRLFPQDDPAESRPSEGESPFGEEEIDRLKDLANEAPIIRLVQRVIGMAVEAKASDIHFEPAQSAFSVRFRQDGLLHPVESHPPATAAAVVSRVKVMAGLNIAERRLPQDGRLRVTMNGKEIDFRVSTTPQLHGESLVLRILDRQDVSLDFEVMGFDPPAQRLLRQEIARPHGIVLVTGPTGSGKTTTLYAALKELNTPARKILTIEDPVEYTLDGINQMPLRPQVGLTFASALRAFLRQDPDIMMVGEIRDHETADVAIQAALTGHLLLSTLHTNSAAGAITRLLDMGVQDYLLTSTLHLVVGQRLVRKVCVHCREAYEPAPDALQILRAEERARGTWYRAKGCERCRGTGYRGRTVIVEMLQLTDRIRSGVLQRLDAHAIERIAVEEGMKTLRAHGVERIDDGVTTVEEVLRAVNAA